MRVLISFLLSLLLMACANEAPTSTEESTTTPVVEEVKEVKPKAKHPDGKYEERYPSGMISKIGNYHDGLEEGEWLSFYEEGQQWSKLHYKAGKKHGKVIAWYPNGKVRYEGYYEQDEKKGDWKFYDEEGNLVKEKNY